jgi:hypothetical protein
MGAVSFFRLQEPQYACSMLANASVLLKTGQKTADVAVVGKQWHADCQSN